MNTYLFAGGRFRPPFYVLSLGINDRRIINQEAAVENKNASKKKTEEPMSLKDKKDRPLPDQKELLRSALNVED